MELDGSWPGALCALVVGAAPASIPLGGGCEFLIDQITDRGEALGLRFRAGTEELDNRSPPRIERPAHWGGYRLWADAVELWIEGADRIHDRARWSRNIVPASGHTFSVSPWQGTRLQP